jgi:hypothetical protein
MKYLISLVLTISFIPLVFCQNKFVGNVNQKETGSLNLLFLTDAGAAGQAKFVQENNLETYTIFYQQFFVKENKVDEKMLQKQIETRIPNINATGFAVLDWEGEAYETFKNNQDNKKIKYFVKEFVKAIKVAKKLRPNVKWGYYNLPYLSYWTRPGTINNIDQKLNQIYVNEDFIAPSLYVYYPDEKHNTSNMNYIKNTLRAALMNGKQYKKPVYPFIWQRAHPRFKDRSSELLPEIYFKETVKTIANFETNGIKAEGVFWWHSESYTYRNKNKFKTAEKEYSKVTHVEQYQYNFFKRYYNSIKAYLNTNENTN